MQPNSFLSLQELALTDPVAAYGRLLGLQTRPVTLNVQASFSSFALNQIPISQPLDQIISRRTWVDNLTFELQLPNAFVGNILLPDALMKMKASPGVSVRTTVMSGPRYLITDTFTPLENFVNVISSRWQAGWQIYKNQQVKTDFMLTAIPFNDPSNTPPYVVTLTYNGWQFDDMSLTMDEISCDQAQNELCAAGVLVAKQMGVRTIFCAAGG